MALSPPPYVETPHVAYVDFYVGGVNITKFPDGKPKALVSFRHEKATDTSGFFSLTIIDPTWNEVVSDIVAAMGSNGTASVSFEYGYYGGKAGHEIKSRTFEGVITKVTPNFIIDGIQLVIEGYDNLALMGIVKRSDSYPSTLRDGFDGNNIFLRPDEIVTWMAHKHGFSVKAEKCKEVKIADAHGSTRLVPMRYIQNHMTDLQFIKQVLVPVAISEKTGEAGYVVYLDEVNKKELHFHPPYKNKPPKREFIYMREKASEVLSFDLEYEGQFIPATGGFEAVAQHYVDSLTAKTGEIKKHNDNTPEKTYLSGYKVPFAMTVAIRTNMASGLAATVPTENEKVAEARALSRYFAAWNVCGVKANMTIVGDDDDNIQKDSVITVWVIQPDGKPHPSSGNYHVWGKVDELSGGRWTTTLQLQREGDMGVGEVVTQGHSNVKGGGK